MSEILTKSSIILTILYLSMDTPDKGDTVFVTVGTAMPREDRALVKGTAIKIDEMGDGTFVLSHDEVIEVGVYGERFYKNDTHAKEEMADAESGPYGEEYDEEYGEVWAYDVEELR